MEKLELKHIVGYLPYGLKVIYISMYENGFRKKHSVKELVLTPSNLEIGLKDVDGVNQKPILRPLSDLTKEIDDIIIYNSLSRRSKNDFDTLCHSVLKWSHEDVEILLKHHFDIHGLIEKGLAIDLNTIENGIQ